MSSEIAGYASMTILGMARYAFLANERHHPACRRERPLCTMGT